MFNLSNFPNTCFNLCRRAQIQVATYSLYQTPSFRQVSSQDPGSLHGFSTEDADLRTDAWRDLNYFFDCWDDWRKTAAELPGGVVKQVSGRGRHAEHVCSKIHGLRDFSGDTADNSASCRWVKIICNEAGQMYVR